MVTSATYFLWATSDRLQKSSRGEILIGGISLGDYYEAIRLQISLNRHLEQPPDLQAAMSMTGICQAPQTQCFSGQNREYDGAAIAYVGTASC